MTAFFDQLRQQTEARFQANFTALAANRIKFENQPFTQPNDNEYVALWIRDGEGGNVALGNSLLRRHPGVVIVQVFALAEKGTKLARDHADTIAAIFRNVQISITGGVIRFREPRGIPVGEGNGWWQLNVECPFQLDIT